MKNIPRVLLCIYSFFAWFIFCAPLYTQAQEASYPTAFSVSPNKCIALHKGEVCYQSLVFEWTANKMGDYCIVDVSTQHPLECWYGSDNGELAFEFESIESKSYQLKDKSGEYVLGEVQVKLATVYKTSKKSFSGWRLF